MPPGLTAGSDPVAISLGPPPATGTDSASSRQPRRTAKYTTPDGETEISPPSTWPGTSVRLTTPVAGLSTTGAPAVVTATMPGGTGMAVAAGEADGYAVVVTVMVGLAAGVP